MGKMVRRNASDKLKLIQMVHDNPILWDSRLPNFKGAEEDKTRAWQCIGNEFNVPGRRVARAFKSLRESYRRELAHVKVMGAGFQPKWSLFMAMDFLREVIRERKNGSANIPDNTLSTHHINSGAGGGGVNSKSMKSNHNTSHRSSLNVSDDYYYFVKPELAGGTPHQQSQQSQQPQQHPEQQHPDSRISMNTVTSTHNDTTNNTSAFDDMDESSLRSEDTSHRHFPSQNGSDEVEELEAIDADFPYPLILENANSPSAKRRRKNGGGGGGGIGGGGGGVGGSCGVGGGVGVGVDDDDDIGASDRDYEGQMMHQHRHQQQNHHHHYRQQMNMSPDSQPQTIREVLNTKFCGFISAKLNSMGDSEADNLMNRILMLLVQTQVPHPQINGGFGAEAK